MTEFVAAVAALLIVETLSTVIPGLDPGTHPASPPTMGGWVYLLASRRNGTLYVGVTSDLVTRIWQHREGVVPGFTSQYGVKLLVWYEEHGRIETAIQREHNIKHWSRQWKIDLISASNPEWLDLWPDINQPVAR